STALIMPGSWVRFPPFPPISRGRPSIQPNRTGARGGDFLPVAADSLRIAAFPTLTDQHGDAILVELHVVAEREVGSVVGMVVRLDHVVQVPPLLLVPVDIHGTG